MICSWCNIRCKEECRAGVTEVSAREHLEQENWNKQLTLLRNFVPNAGLMSAWRTDILLYRYTAPAPIKPIRSRYGTAN